VHERYFDNAATTPVDPRVVEEMLPYFSEAFGNANSIHEPGQRARAAVELARERVAALLEADPYDIIFTSGATESNNWIASAADVISCSPFEHSSMLEAVRWYGHVLDNDGYVVQGPNPRIAGELMVCAIMHVNNETGAMLNANVPLPENTKLARDLTQTIGKVSLPDEAPLDLATFSAHKFYGPKGVGCLWMPSVALEPMLKGGEQEDGFRAGTLNVPGIVGMGAAATIATEEAQENRRNVETLRALALGEILKISDAQLNSPPGASPYIVSLSFLGVEGEALVVEADRAGFSISSGAACSSRSTEPSHVLVALGMSPEWIRGTIRISFGKYNTESATMSLAKELRIAVEKLRTMS
jgi:cysteine desulfurase